MGGMKVLLFFILSVNCWASTDCVELRKQAQKLTMQQESKDPKDLLKYQRLVDALQDYEKKEDVDQIVKSDNAQDYLKLNNFCIFTKDIETILKRYIRSALVVELSPKQKKIIKKKSLNLVRKMSEKLRTSEAILISYRVLFELADFDMINKKGLNNLLVSFEEFQEDYKKRTRELIAKLAKSDKRAALRRDFYQKDIRLAKRELKIIAPFLAKD